MHAIVGNGPLSPSDRKNIATANRIVRFNLTHNLYHEPAARTDELFLSCSSKQIGNFLSQGRYRCDNAFQQAARIVLPYHPDIIRRCMRRPSILSRLKGRRADWTEYCIEIANQAKKKVEILTPTQYYEACCMLEIDTKAKDFFPSSGFLAILRELKIQRNEANELHIFGFGFSGWKGHRWEKEQSIVTAFKNAGLLTLHPIGAAVAAD